ncbi:transglutaminase domain-containing protein [Arabiibacter massiliensis]|uniref:transglutaminase domain-containing protein n=1 Tax=Arabiibacter massiliensis TaxID=1870985 RepID=UPI0009BAC9B9|nr:transglutaminase-like domain-containing protein [Arabiibacter massiliensis]
MASARALRRALEGATDGIVRRARGARGMDAVLMLHDWLIGRFSYGELPGGLAHEAAGPLLHGAGVCEGAAKAFELLCGRCGIPCLVAIGASRDPARGAGWEPHAWNLVMIEGRDGAPGWFHVDATFDAALSTTVPRRDYLCLGDAEIARDHRFGAGSLPPCPRAWGYYESVGRFAGTRSALLRMAREAGLRGERTLVFQLPFLEGADEAFLARMGSEAARELAGCAPGPRGFTLACNPSQMTCQVNLAKDA